MSQQKKKKTSRILMALALLLVATFIISATLGRFTISLQELLQALSERMQRQSASNEMIHTVLFESRFPRMFAAVLIGCGLSVSGATYQGIFRNPMVSPDLLAASAGAGCGAAFGLLFGFPDVFTQLTAFGFGLFAVLATCVLARLVSGSASGGRMVLVLCGMVVGSLFQAVISLIKYVADPFDTMPSIAFWLMGGFTYVVKEDLWFLVVPILAGTILVCLLRWRINVLSFGEEEALALGVPVKCYQRILIFCATLMTAACVSVGGMIGWVGLIVPHLARLLVGPDYRALLPCSALLGGIFLLVVDDVARCAFPQELPIGILTAMIGAPLFLLLLAKGKRGFLA
jgi:iron complex transport system permease protein